MRLQIQNINESRSPKTRVLDFSFLGFHRYYLELCLDLVVFGLFFVGRFRYEKLV